AKSSTLFVTQVTRGAKRTRRPNNVSCRPHPASRTRAAHTVPGPPVPRLGSLSQRALHAPLNQQSLVQGRSGPEPAGQLDAGGNAELAVVMTSWISPPPPLVAGRWRDSPYSRPTCVEVGKFMVEAPGGNTIECSRAITNCCINQEVRAR